MKHAVRRRAGGEVIVSLHGGTKGQLSLRLRDDCVELPAGFDWRQADSLRRHLMQMLAEQLHATLRMTSGKGTECAVLLGPSDHLITHKPRAASRDVWSYRGGL